MALKMVPPNRFTLHLHGRGFERLRELCPFSGVLLNVDYAPRSQNLTEEREFFSAERSGGSPWPGHSIHETIEFLAQAGQDAKLGNINRADTDP